MTSEAKARFLTAHPVCEICGGPAVQVDHDHATDLVRGALCRTCNSRLGSLEVALLLPEREFQAMARDLHREFRQTGTVNLTRFRADLAYLQMPANVYLERLAQVHRQLVASYVYWTEVTSRLPSRTTTWTKTGPLADADETERHRARLAASAPPHLWIRVTLEPDDGVNSPFPRSLVTHSSTDGASEAYRALLAADPHDMSAYDERGQAFAELVVPVLLSRPGTAAVVREEKEYLAAAAPAGSAGRPEWVYRADWVDEAVRIVIEDLAGDLPDPRWATPSRARWHWRKVCAHWRDRQPRNAAPTESA